MKALAEQTSISLTRRNSFDGHELVQRANWSDCFLKPMSVPCGQSDADDILYDHLNV